MQVEAHYSHTCSWCLETQQSAAVSRMDMGSVH